MARPRLLDLSDELLSATITHLATVADTLALDLTCKRLHQLARTSAVWRRHCIDTWTHWDDSHQLDAKLSQPPLRTDWRALYVQRAQTDRRARHLFDALLQTQQAHDSHMHDVAVMGADVRDLLLGLARRTPDDADDVLARRWHASAIEKLMCRREANDIWCSLDRGDHVELEDALAAYDHFVLGSDSGLSANRHLFDQAASTILSRTPGFLDLTTRQRAVQIAQYLQDEGIVGMDDNADYHALRNNFINLAFAADARGCLPLQSVAIYCAVARRLGVEAWPCNSPRHVIAIVFAPAGKTLDGNPRTTTDRNSEDASMHMDPFNHSYEVPRAFVRDLLRELREGPDRWDEFFGPASTVDMVMRAGENILFSLEAADMPDGVPLEDSIAPVGPRGLEPQDASFAASWALLFVFGRFIIDGIRERDTEVVLDRLDVYPHDTRTVHEMVTSLLDGVPQELVLGDVEYSMRKDRKPKIAKRRVSEHPVAHRIGTHFEHRVYKYEGFIIGWDASCAARKEWIKAMRVDDLPRGRNQPFYKIIAKDKTKRYVAEENIQPLRTPPSDALLRLAGRYFKRWDHQNGIFVSNLRDEYPDD